MMDVKSQQMIDKFKAPPSVNHCFAIQANTWVDRPTNDFMDTDFHLPALFESEGRFQSKLIVVLTSRPSVRGRLMSACLGYVVFDPSDDDLEYQNYLEWHSGDGQQVIGWMPVPVFHVDENTELQQGTSDFKNFYFKYQNQ